MRIQKLHIKNFRYIRSLEICDIENALILVGKITWENSSSQRALRSRRAIRDCRN